MQTAKEFLNNKFKEIYYKQPKGLTSHLSESRYLELHVTGRIDGKEQNYPEMMIEFAKLHVEAALKAAYNMALQEYLITDAGIGYFTNIYPLTLIK